MQFLQFFFSESQVIDIRKHLQKEKWKKNANDYFIAVLLLFYGLKYLILTKNRFFNEKSGIVPEVKLT